MQLRPFNRSESLPESSDVSIVYAVVARGADQRRRRRRRRGGTRGRPIAPFPATHASRARPLLWSTCFPKGRKSASEGHASPIVVPRLSLRVGAGRRTRTSRRAQATTAFVADRSSRAPTRVMPRARSPGIAIRVPVLMVAWREARRMRPPGLRMNALGDGLGSQ